MSGQPYVYASDPERYRAMYMENLNNVAKMDDLVLQAVKEYTQTGMIPPAAQLIDNRTTSEKLADIEKLKLGIVKDLEPIMDSQTALNLVKGLSQSPLNSDNKLIIFFAQTGKALIDKLKEQYKYGIKGDQNDIETFVDFVNSAYSKRLKGVQSVKELLQGSNMGRDLVNVGSLEQYRNSVNGILPMVENIFARALDIPKFRALQARALAGDPNAVAEVATMQQNRAQVVRKIQDLRILLDNLITDMPTDAEQANMMRFINQTGQPAPGAPLIALPVVSPNINLYTETLDILRTSLPKKEVVDGLINQLKSAVDGKNINLGEQVIDQLNGMFGGLDRERQVLRNAKARVAAEVQANPQPAGGAAPGGVVGAFQAIGNRLGFGLRKRPGRPKGSGVPLHLKIDPNYKIEPMPQYTQFGKFLINNHRLSEDIMSLRSGKGHVIKDMPPFKLSPQFKKVVKKITGGSIPTEDDINSLTDDEIKYLNKLSKRANVYDKLNIPTPSKSKEEQDMHDFEVMKGEIMSGNDNSDLIKKFKILLMKFHKHGKIPKNEYHEIMEDLMSLSI